MSAPISLLLGVAQDSGHPQAGCRGPCCAAAWANPELAHRAVSLAIVDPQSGERWLIEASPDFPHQLHALEQAYPRVASPSPQENTGRQLRAPPLDGIFLSHGHIGHYAGLMHLGREVMNTQRLPVYVLPRMAEFLRTSGPWELLVRLGNIDLHILSPGDIVPLNGRIGVETLLVPHRGEYTETAAFIVHGPSKSLLFLPDIDSWPEGRNSVEQLLARVDVAYLDATFFSGDELPGRSMADIPHPLVTESLARLAPLPASERAKVRFVHFNHTNPLLVDGSAAVAQVQGAGHHVARRGEVIEI
jgi:pyrroloquinoline quinone biosynthesis protein B